MSNHILENVVLICMKLLFINKYNIIQFVVIFYKKRMQVQCICTSFMSI